MADDTTTSTAVDEQALETEQLDTSTDNGEAVETDETSQTSETEEESEAKADDTTDDFNDWAAKKNLPLDDPEKLGRMYRDLETKLGSGERNLSKSVETANTEAGVDDVQATKNQVAALSFYVTNPDAAKYDEQMGKLLEEKPWMANDLSGLLDMAKGRTITSDEQLLAAKQAGSKEALATAANAQRASAPKTSATNRSTPGKLTDADIKNMSLSEYQKAKADGLIDPFGDRPE